MWLELICQQPELTQCYLFSDSSEWENDYFTEEIGFQDSSLNAIWGET